MQDASFDLKLRLTQAVQAASFDAAIDRILIQICEFTNWDYAEAWLPNPEGTILELHPACYIATHRSSTALHSLEQFRICSRGFTFPPGAGLPGRVWQTQAAEWLPDAAAHSEHVFLRHYIAKTFGIKAGFGLPIATNRQVFAVLAFFMQTYSEEPTLTTTAVATAVAQIAEQLSRLDRT